MVPTIFEKAPYIDRREAISAGPSEFDKTVAYPVTM